MMRNLICALCFYSLSACAHVAEIIDNQSIETDTLEDNTHRIVSMSGDRRLIRTTLTGRTDSNPGNLQVCAETQADALTARGSDASLAVTGKGSLSDSITEHLTVTYARTELSDVVRQLSWQMCNANMNGKLGDDSYRLALFELQRDALQVLKTRALTDSTAALKALQEQNAKTIAEATKQQDARQAELAAREKAAAEASLAKCKAEAGQDQKKLAKCY